MKEYNDTFIDINDVDLSSIIDRIRETFEQKTRDLHIEIEKAIITAIVKYYEARKVA